MSDDATESRLNDLEIKLSYSEDMLDELNRTVFRQQQQIDRLIAEVRSLHEQVRNPPSTREPTSLRDELPPHY